MILRSSQWWWLGVVGATALFGSLWIFCLGLGGQYVLDDYENLRLLGELSAPLTLGQIIDFLIVGGQTTGMTGRPISLLTFAVQYSAWPNSPAAFKLVNIAIHLLNSGLVFWIAVRVLSEFIVTHKAVWLALWAATFWMLHPIQISTVLYIVQRMAELSAMFMLLSVALYLEIRRKLSDSNAAAMSLRASILLLVGGGLAVFSKENGIILPLLLLVLEYTVFSKKSVPMLWARWRLLALWLPSLLLLGYLLSLALAPPNAAREFTPVERLLTQPRVLLDYLGKILLPRPQTFGLFFDDYNWSTSLVSPPSTLIAVILVVSGVACALLLRRKWPLFAFAILWFLAAHILESSTILLELYFEHRNYVPFVGVAIALPGVVGSSVTTSKGQFALSALGVLVILGAAIMAMAEARLWSNNAQLFAVWGQAHPDSPRALVARAASLVRLGQSQMAYDELLAGADRLGDASGLLAAAMTVPCDNDQVELVALERIRHSFQFSPFSHGPLQNIVAIVAAKEQGKCSRIPDEYVLAAADSLNKNKKFTDSRLKGHLYFQMAKLYALQRKLAPAISYSRMATELAPRVDIYLVQVDWLVSAGAWRDADQFLLEAEQILATDLRQRKVYGSQIAEYRQMINGHFANK